MTNRLRRLSVAVVLPILLWACGGNSTSLTGPSSPTYTVSGVVFERTATGSEPVEGIWVAEASSRRGARTDENGVYRIADLAAGTISLSASGSSYYVATTEFLISGDSRKDI